MRICFQRTTYERVLQITKSVFISYIEEDRFHSLWVFYIQWEYVFYYIISPFNHHQSVCYDTNTLNVVCDLTDASLETANAQLFHIQGCEDCSSSVVWDEST